MGNTNTINQTFDLLTLVEQDTALRRTGAGWWAGPCPFCGGVDRFTLKQTASGWRWFCRHCGGDRYHTPVDYIMQRQACTFPSALAWINGMSTNHSTVDFTPDKSGVKSTKITTTTSSIGDLPMEEDKGIWQARGLAYLQACKAALWTEPGEQALNWLHLRGLKDDTLHHYHIGYNPKDAYDPLPLWGFPEPTGGGRHAVWLPRGIVIPCWEDSQLWYLKTRRPLTRVQERKSQQKYVKVKGSQAGLFGAWNLRGAWLAVLTEGELDCMLLDLQAGDLAGVATLGSATDRINRLDLSTWGKWLLYVAHFLVAYDLDVPGEKGLHALVSFTKRAHQAVLPTLPGVKDITDFHLAGGDLGDWLCRTVEQLKLLDPISDSTPQPDHKDI